MAKVSMSHLFPSQDIKQNRLLSSYLDKWWCHKILRFFLNHLLKQWLTGKKRGRWKYKNLYIWRMKSFLVQIKTIFHSFWRAITWWKINVWWKIVDTSFKIYLGLSFLVLLLGLWQLNLKLEFSETE